MKGGLNRRKGNLIAQTGGKEVSTKKMIEFNVQVNIFREGKLWLAVNEDISCDGDQEGTTTAIAVECDEYSQGTSLREALSDCIAKVIRQRMLDR